jgi:hypothetical protein
MERLMRVGLYNSVFLMLRPGVCGLRIVLFGDFEAEVPPT